MASIPEWNVSSASLFAVIGWIVIAIGWFITSHQANKREKRKELRSQIDSLIKSIEELEHVAELYYSTEKQEKFKHRLRIFPSIQKIENKGFVLNKSNNTFVIDTEFANLWESITDKDFDSAKLKKLSIYDPRYARISSSSSKLIKKIETWYLDNI